MNTKRKATLIASIAMTALTPTLTQASIPLTRQTHDNIVMYDDGQKVRAYNKVFGGTELGVVSLDALNKELSEDDGLRTTQSRYSCETPFNTITRKPQDLFPNEQSAQLWIASCFTDEVVYNIEVDLATLMEREKATRGIYQFRDTVKIRNSANPNQVDERDVYYEIVLNKNDKPGFGQKTGVRLSPGEHSKNLYIVYKNTNTVELFNNVETSDRAGEFIVYEMDGSVPENSNLTELDSFPNPAFDTSRLQEPSQNFYYETQGVKNVLVIAREYRDDYNAETVVVDYYNPINLKNCATNGNGKCLPSNSSVEDPDFIPMLNVFTTERTFYRNVCTRQGVTYKQSNTIQAEVEEYIERYLIKGDTVIKNDMTNEELLSLNRLAPFNFDSKGTIEEDFNNAHTFDYNTDINFFDNRITDYLNKNASAPNNAFIPHCTGAGSFDSEECYDANSLHHDHYKDPIPNVQDISIVDVTYEQRTLVEKERVEVDEEGNETLIPAVYEWQRRNTCNTHSGTRNYNVNNFCNSSSDIRCISKRNK